MKCMDNIRATLPEKGNEVSNSFENVEQRVAAFIIR